MTERIAESGQSGTNPQEAAEIARKKGMTKGTCWRGRIYPARFLELVCQ